MSKIYVLTGATSGIGKALLQKLNGNIVFAGYRNNEFVSTLKSMGAIPFYIDMENSQSIENAANFIKSKTDKIDTLFNIAGCVVAGATEKISTDKIRQQFEINTFSHFDFTQKLLPLLNEGKIINISSMASFGIFPFVAPYCASKRALDIIFNSMLLESNIKVISIKPGVIATPLWDKSIEFNKDSIENCYDYQKEMKYLISNAKKNGQNGLPVKKVVEKIIQVDKMEKPKPSYTIGKDAKFAEIFSKLPFSLQNKLIKYGMKYKFDKPIL